MPPENPWAADVREFHETARVYLRSRPELPTPEERELAISLIKEESAELVAALQQEDLVETADGVIDLLIVTIRLGIVMGLPLDKLWAEVHASNMSKFDQNDGRYAIFREDGKVLKGPRFRKPHLIPIIIEARGT